MTAFDAKLDGLVPAHLQVRSASVLLDSLDVSVDIGFHDFEVGTPQRLLVTIEIWLEDVSLPMDDDPVHAFDYDYLRNEVHALAAGRRYNLQETFAHALFDRFAALKGVKAIRVATAKPDIYSDARGVGVQITSYI
jgi:7,8-dihydroneopterin aldolase/epimerase/oxygenase